MCFDRDDTEMGTVDESLRTEQYEEIESLIGQLNTLFSPVDGGESLALHLLEGHYVLDV